MKHKFSGTKLKTQPQYIKSKPMASPMPEPSKVMNVNVKKIENGYLIHHSGMRGDKYVEKTYHSPTNPLHLKSRKRK